MTASNAWLDVVRWNESGLAPVIAQDFTSGEVLMLAWMTREALALTLERGEAVYWSRSRNALWHKGETSGHFQRVREIRLDCDADALLIKVEQVGGAACHTGRRHCFFNKLEAGAWVVTENVISLGNPQVFRTQE